MAVLICLSVISAYACVHVCTYKYMYYVCVRIFVCVISRPQTGLLSIMLTVPLPFCLPP